MPELPEVETTRRGIEPAVVGKTFQEWIVRDARLRWPIEPDWPNRVRGQRVEAVVRRSKYLILEMASGGALITHLGMSGQLRILPAPATPEKHDHCDWWFTEGTCIRYRDPRRFGAMLWTDQPWPEHPRIRRLGPEPLSADFTPETFYLDLKRRTGPIKSALMDAALVVGVGNIYANEALFMAGIHPRRPANRISRRRVEQLCQAIKDVLAAAIAQGGTTLRDYYSLEGQAGYFHLELAVYGRAGQACPGCHSRLREIRQSGRSTVYCPACQR